MSSGTTCFADQHLFSEVIAQTAAAAYMRVCVGLPVAGHAERLGGIRQRMPRQGPSSCATTIATIR